MEFVSERPTMRRALRIAAVVLMAAAMFIVAGIGLLRRGDGEAGAPAGPLVLDAGGIVGPAISTGSLTAAIARLQERVRERPSDWRSLAALGAAYVQQARITADPSYYPKADGVLERSLRIERDENFEAYVARGSLEAARHDFAAALRDGRRAARINPYDADAYGVIGDAQLELGRYGQGFETFQRMVDTEPNLESYARVSYARELQGDVPGAMRAMADALDAAGSAADAAWASHQLGELAFNRGDVGRAARYYRRARRLDPTYEPAEAGIAKVSWARGDLDTAIDRFVDVTQRYPAPEYVVVLADLYQLAGRSEEASRQEELLGSIEQLQRANGVNIDLELALHHADRGDADVALRAARAEWSRRRSVHVADALAWALYRGGRYPRAQAYATRALRLGTRDALFHFHAGMIRLRLGDREAAYRLLRAARRINPYFSIRWSPVAEHVLERLEKA
jgi:tetratricopeptide (TPR) repeat protein